MADNPRDKFDVNTLREQINADPKKALNDHEILREMAVMKDRNPAEFDLFVEEIKKTHKGIRVETIRSQVDKHAPPKADGDVNDTEIEKIPEDLVRHAMRIAEHGKPLKFMVNTFNRTHKGDRIHGQSQFINFGQQSAVNTKGAHGTWEGPSGKGKTDAAKAAVRQLPTEYVITSSITAKSLYHRATVIGILPGTVLSLDDKNILAGSDLEETVKKIQTYFQEGAEHETLDGNGGYVKTKLPPRLVVVRTYINTSDSDDQLRNRTQGYGVDSSKETYKDVCDLVLKLGEQGQNTDVVTKQTLICRALWRDIKKHAYRVKTPASSRLVEFTDVSNRRNPSLFLDMVSGLACIRHRQRIVEDAPNGEKILYANYEDYLDAAEIFNSQGDYLGTRLDKTEYKAVEYIEQAGPEGASVSGIFVHLMTAFPNDGWNVQKVRRLMDGRPDRDIKGLADKVPGMDVVWKVNDTGSKYKVYSMLCNAGIGLKVIIHNPYDKNVSDEDLSHLSHSSPRLGKGIIDNNNTTIPTYYPNSPNNEKVVGNTTPVKGGESVLPPDIGGKVGKTGKGGQGNEPHDMGKHPFPTRERTGKGREIGVLRSPEEWALWKRTCVICGTVYDEDLLMHLNGGYQCNSCHEAHRNESPRRIRRTEDQPPMDPSQMTLEEVGT